jgi:hypothetical protein
MVTSIKTLGVSYEIVESVESLNKCFEGHSGFFDGVIAPSNAPPETLSTIGENPYVKLRDLPIFVYGNTSAIQRRLVAPSRVTLGYRGVMRDQLASWIKQL